MKSNMGIIDKFLRIFSAMFIAGAYYMKEIKGITAVLLLILASIFMVTSFVGFCPLYSIFGITTKKTNNT